MRAALAGAALLVALACPAMSDAAVGVIFHDGYLTAAGGDGSDYLQVYCGSDGIPRVSGVAPSNQIVPCRRVTFIELYGGGGGDIFDLRLVGREFGTSPGAEGAPNGDFGPFCFAAGSAGSDRYLTGKPFFEAFSGGAGPDVYLGDGGFDFVLAGAGRDRVFGHRGSDIVVGGGEGDLLRGGRGADAILGGSGNDRVAGGAASDDLFAGSGRDRVRGGRGDDLLDGGIARDFLFGGPGGDHLYGGRGHDLIRGGPGVDHRFPDKSAPDKPFGEGTQLRRTRRLPE